MIYTAANEEFLNINKVVEQPASEFLMFINFVQRKNELDAKRLRKNIKK